MNRPGLPPGVQQGASEQPDFADLPLADIPEAVREMPTGEVLSRPVSSASRLTHSKPASSRPTKLLWYSGTGFVALLGLGLWFVPRLLSPTPAAVQPLETTTPEIQEQAIDLLDQEQPAALLNHLPYTEAPRTDLKPLTADGKVLLRQSAAAKFKEMAAAAKADGVILVPLSGFRSIADQERVFFDVKAKRGQDAEKRAAVSAPPGYSEHHTGYAIDLGDANRPATDLQASFETTAAFRWLKKNAAFYSFELSFPKNNPMGVSYEPWHWRFVGDRNSLETFYRAREQSNP
ncbi:M15 family metallopeptidase [Leptolyngbya ohadii]|uniref:M15 family metallopeptidase n=1 Tax=Leptolyngbya ohadii TaxID=1962290 RepID=UPI001CEC6E47|nr:M15 family metallopeptidase [Leptolyngbya ohadii]